MSDINEWLDLMPHTIIHTPQFSRTDYGKPVYAFPVSYRARVVFEEVNVRGDDGNIVVARGTVWINGTPFVKAEDKITLPDGTSPPVLNSTRYTDDQGIHHTRVYFG